MKKQLPLRPNLEQLKKQAKALLKGHKTSNLQVLRQIQEHHPCGREKSELEIRNSQFTLSDAQLVIAKEYGFPNWSALRKHVLSHQSNPSDDAAIKLLLEAAANGDLSRVTELLDTHPNILNERGGPGSRTALHFAAMRLHEPVVKLLLERGADPNIRCEGDSATPLHFATEQGHLGIIRLLVEHGADTIGEGDYHELEVIGWATCFAKGNSEIVDFLTAHGAQHHIFSAVAMGEIEVIQKLVAQSRSNLEKRMDLTNLRRRPLHLAVVKKKPQSLAALLDLGANTESLDEAGLTALDQAALSGENEIAQLLLDRGAKIRLPAAIALQRTRDINQLLRKDPECLKPGNRWGNLIVRASAQAPGHIIETLIHAGASVNVRDNPKTSVDSTSSYMPLHAAAFHGNLDAASVLLKHGANVRIRDEKYLGTPAGWAAYAGHTAVRDLILNGPIDIFEAIEMGLADRIPNIIKREPEALERPYGDYLGNQSGTLQAAGSFIEGVKREAWRTPLAFAVAAGNFDAVRILLEHGADQTIRAPDGRTLVQISQEKSLEQITNLLKRHETKK